MGTSGQREQREGRPVSTAERAGTVDQQDAVLEAMGAFDAPGGPPPRQPRGCLPATRRRDDPMEDEALKGPVPEDRP